MEFNNGYSLYITVISVLQFNAICVLLIFYLIEATPAQLISSCHYRG